MTIQRLSGIQNFIANFFPKNPSYPKSTTSSFSFYYQSPASSCHLLKEIWYKVRAISAASSGILVVPNCSFKKYLCIEETPSIRLEKKPERGSFVDKLLNEANETIKSNVYHLMTDGDKAFAQKDFVDAEKCYAEALKTVSHSDDSLRAMCAEKLGTVYLVLAKAGDRSDFRKEECIKAAGLFNFGLLLACNQKEEELQKKIQVQLRDVEATLVSLCRARIRRDTTTSLDTENKLALKEIRQNFQDRLLDSFERPEEVKELFQEITSEMKSFTSSLIEQVLGTLGNPPRRCRFAVIGFGSMARGEMTPFSDLEFAILIEEGKDTEEVKQYFRNFTYLMHLKVLNLSETIVPILGIKALEGFYDDVTPKGFAFDGKSSTGRGYKTPLGKEGVFELIQTPAKMAAFQGKSGDLFWYEKEPFLPTELHNITFIYGKEELVKSYRKELNCILNKESKDGSTLKEYYAKRHLFSKDTTAFEVVFSAPTDGMLFDLKKDLYRMPHLLIERLFLKECKNLPEDGSLEGSFSKIEWLVKEGKICFGGG